MLKQLAWPSESTYGTDSSSIARGALTFARSLAVTVVLFAPGLIDADPAETSGAHLLAAALEHHDPDGSWVAGRFTMTLESHRPDGSTREIVLDFDNRVGSFGATRESDAGLIEAEIGPGERCELKLAGSAEIPPKTAEKHGVTCERWRRMRDYYHYMWGLPMKLADEGTLLGAGSEGEFNGVAARVLAVTYEPETGGDTWYFYFDPATARAVGYRFYHDPATNDGEYIVLEGEVEAGGVRFPRRQTWYMNDDDELLGSDELIAAERLD